MSSAPPTEGFEWDQRKAAQKLKEGVSFLEATETFDDLDSFEFPDEREDYGEERWIIIGMTKKGRLLTVVYFRPNERSAFASSRHGSPTARSGGDTMSKADEDRPFTYAELARIPRVRPSIRTLRRRLKMSQAEFAQAFGFNPATLRDWEQGRSAPDQAVRSFLKVIASDPESVRKILATV